jgi:hypothetical protein
MSDAADKLARTRLAIIDHVQRRERRQDGRDADRTGRKPGEEQDEERSGRGAAGWFSGFKRAAGSWWRHHPAHMCLELATPVLAAYASKKPAQFLGIAAAVGALVMVVRPWRLISLTGLVVALVKSSQLSSVIMSAMSAADFQKDDQPRR